MVKQETNILNFAAGPSVLPATVLAEAQGALIDYNNTGQSILEINHRSHFLEQLHDEIFSALKQILTIPNNYNLLLLHGGATQQFTVIPNNLLSDHDTAIYLQTGEWSRRAYHAAKQFFDVEKINVVNCYEFTKKTIACDHAKYVYLTSNETSCGLEWQHLPTLSSGVPLIADMSSNFLTKQINVNDYGLLYASAQKNIGVAGLVLMLISDEIMEDCNIHTPEIFNYRAQLAKKSTVNTPSFFSWYVLLLMLQWIIDQGGIKIIEEKNLVKAKFFYDFIDNSSLYVNTIDPLCRSNVNIIFDLPTQQLTARFIEEAKQHGIINIKGHASRGGIRISLYNAIPLHAVEQLVEFMTGFEQYL